MTNQAKISEVANIQAKIAAAKAVYLADYRGIKVKDVTKLRETIKAAGGELNVIKNKLLLRALRANKYRPDEKQMIGPSIVLFANSDEVAPLKALAAFGKLTSLLPFKVGYLNQKILSGADVTKLSTLPSTLELQTKLVGLLISQPTRLVYSLKSNLTKLVFALNSIKAQKA